MEARSASAGSTEHSAYLPGLDPQKEYHFKITATDVDNETSSTPDKLSYDPETDRFGF